MYITSCTFQTLCLLRYYSSASYENRKVKGKNDDVANKVQLRLLFQSGESVKFQHKPY